MEEALKHQMEDIMLTLLLYIHVNLGMLDLENTKITVKLRAIGNMAIRPASGVIKWHSLLFLINNIVHNPIIFLLKTGLI